MGGTRHWKAAASPRAELCRTELLPLPYSSPDTHCSTAAPTKHHSRLLGWQLPPGHSTFHSQPTHHGKFKDRKKGAELQLLLWLCPGLGRPCAWGRSKLLLPSGAEKVTRNRFCGSPMGAGHSLPVLSIPTLTTKLPHAWPVPGQLSPGISTWTANAAAGAKLGTGDKEKPGHERGRVGTGSWLICGLRGAPDLCGPGDQTLPSFPQPLVPFPGKGGHCSPALSQLLQLCSEGSMG